MGEKIELDLTPEEYQKLIEYYMQDNFSKASLEVYMECKDSFEVAAFAALTNEAILVAVKEGMEIEQS